MVSRQLSSRGILFSEITKKINEIFQNPSLIAHPSFKEKEIKNFVFGVTEMENLS
jgi:hypothetical protein